MTKKYGKKNKTSAMNFALTAIIILFIWFVFLANCAEGEKNDMKKVWTSFYRYRSFSFLCVIYSFQISVANKFIHLNN